MTNELREAAQRPWTVEEAISDRSGLIGWLLRLGDQSLQIWRDQSAMPGFRCGSGFVPGIGETITYRAALTATTNEAAAQADGLPDAMTYAAGKQMAVTKEWCRGWDDCRAALPSQPVAGEPVAFMLSDFLDPTNCTVEPIHAAPAVDRGLLDGCEIGPRQLRYSLKDYHIAPGGEGPLAFTWSDKPHRLVYDLIAAVKHYAALAASAPSQAEPWHADAFVAWVQAQPSDREPTTLAEALAEFKRQSQAGSCQASGEVICRPCSGWVDAPCEGCPNAPPAGRTLTAQTPMAEFEDAIRRVGIVAACEWFGHASDSEFTKETVRVLAERSASSTTAGERDHG